MDIDAAEQPETVLEPIADAPHSEHADPHAMDDPLADRSTESDKSVGPADGVPIQDAPTDPDKLLRVNDGGDPVQQGQQTNTKAEDLGKSPDAPAAGPLYGDVKWVDDSDDPANPDAPVASRQVFFNGDAWVSEEDYHADQRSRYEPKDGEPVDDNPARGQIEALRATAEGAHRLLYSSDLRLVLGVFDLLMPKPRASDV